MTQALALRGMLRRAGHEVCQVLVGRSARREVPAFFAHKIDAPLAFFESPNFVCDQRDCAIRLRPTLAHAVRRSPHLRRSLAVLGTHLAQHQPDVVINFFEPVVGLYYALRRPGIPLVCIAHQYLFLHPAYQFPDLPGFSRPQASQRGALKLFTRLTAWGASRRLALSITPMPEAKTRSLVVVPPLLRDELFEQRVVHDDFLLVYLLNSGYARQIEQWHAQHPDVRLHCFWDNPDAAEVERRDATLTFHRLHDEKFLTLMAQCKGLVTTAGFESVCEAMYLGKPALMVPVGGHFEQHCNAHDAEQAGAGLADTQFLIDRLLHFEQNDPAQTARFGTWVQGAEARFVEEIEAAVGDRVVSR